MFQNHRFLVEPYNLFLRLLRKTKWQIEITQNNNMNSQGRMEKGLANYCKKQVNWSKYLSIFKYEILT